MSDNLPLDRRALSRVFTDPRTLLAFEQIQRNALTSGGGVVIDSTTIFTLTGSNAIPIAVDDAAAAALTPPVPVGGVYFNGSVMQVRMI